MSRPPKKKINMLSTSVVIFISVLIIGVICIPRAFGFRTFYVESGSMEPTLKTGSLLYVKTGYSFEEYRPDDIVTFVSDDGKSSFTHRIVGVDYANCTFVTKGDANPTEDYEKADPSCAAGKVQYSIPCLGYVAKALDVVPVKIAVFAAYVAWAAIEIELLMTERKKKNE